MSLYSFLEINVATSFVVCYYLSLLLKEISWYTKEKKQKGSKAGENLLDHKMYDIPPFLSEVKKEKENELAKLVLKKFFSCPFAFQRYV